VGAVEEAGDGGGQPQGRAQTRPVPGHVTRIHHGALNHRGGGGPYQTGGCQGADSHQGNGAHQGAKLHHEVRTHQGTRPRHEVRLYQGYGSQYGAGSSQVVGSQYGAGSSRVIGPQYGAGTSVVDGSQYGAGTSQVVGSQYGAGSYQIGESQERVADHSRALTDEGTRPGDRNHGGHSGVQQDEVFGGVHQGGGPQFGAGPGHAGGVGQADPLDAPYQGVAKSTGEDVHDGTVEHAELELREPYINSFMSWSWFPSTDTHSNLNLVGQKIS